MVQKIIQVGNSLAITIPSGFVKEAGLQAGQAIRVDQDSDTQVLTVQPVKKVSAKEDRLTPEFLDWLKKFNARYKDALTELANK